MGEKPLSYALPDLRHKEQSRKRGKRFLAPDWLQVLNLWEGELGTILLTFALSLSLSLKLFSFCHPDYASKSVLIRRYALVFYSFGLVVGGGGS